MSSSTSQERWYLALASDDAQAAREHFSNMIREVKVVRLAQALAADPLPANILGAMVQEGCFDLQWISQVMEVGIKMDWGLALEWRKAQADSQQLDRELEAAIKEGARSYQILGLGAKGRLVLNDMLVGLFEFRPSLVEQARALGMEDFHLFDLSTHPGSQSWLERSGLDVARILMAGLRHSRHVGRISPWDGFERKEIGWQMEAWLDRSPAHRQAWETIQSLDTLRMEQERDWMSTWLPQEKWEESPLQSWSKTMVERGIEVFPSPLDHPALLPPDGGTFRADRWVGQDYINSLGYPSMEPMADRVRKINNVLRSRNGEYLGSFVLDCPPNYLVSSLKARHAWMEGVMTSEQGARQIQVVMDKDLRATQAAVGWGAKTVIEWTLAQPLWQTWRDQQGNSLLASTLIAMATRDHRLPASLSKAQLLKLVRVAPGLLTDTNTAGQKVLDLVDLKPETRSAVERALLRRIVQAPQRRSKPAGRVM